MSSCTHPSIVVFISYALKYLRIYTTCDNMESFSFNHFLNSVLMFFSQISTGMKKDRFSFTLATKDQ